jgi:hypothetical protein
VITKVLASAAITVVTAVGVAAPATADPGAFGNLSCSCTETVSVNNVVGVDPVNEGFQDGLSDLESTPAPLEP